MGQPIQFVCRGPLRGSAALPGDKSISHRALMLSAMAAGTSRIEGLSGGADVASTAAALRAMGVAIEPATGERATGGWEVGGVGTGCLLQPSTALDMGNSGTSARLLMGLVASHPIEAVFTGDPSLSLRPMDRVIRPLSRIGASFDASPGERLPLRLRGICPAVPHIFRIEVASAQVKSALLLAGLNTPGITRVIETAATRDHGERMLRRFGARLETAEDDGERHLLLHGEAELKAQSLTIPGDFSAAAFLIVAALIVPGSNVNLAGVGLNPMRTGLLEMLRAMGAGIEISNSREISGEPAADLRVRHSPLTAVDVPPAIVPAMIDEFPAFFIAAAFAHGTSRASGLAELRVKESDRIAAMAEGLAAIGVLVGESEDGIEITGNGADLLPGGATIAAHRDHRIAMSFAVAGLHTRLPVGVDDMTPVRTSFPGFAAALASLMPA